MNSIKRYEFTACTVCIFALLAACSSTPLAPPATEPAKPGVPTANTNKAEPAKPLQVRQAEIAAHLDPHSLIARERSVYFDYDEYVVKKEFSAMVERQGKYLAAHPTLAIRVEGNTDERGGAEYNLALGQKRAAAVVQALKVFGVKEQQMEAVSLGKEKPKAAGHDETAWAQNRRVDLAYPNK